MTRPRLLDLFCGAGGAAMGYAQAGFDVVGVDNRPQPRYPFEFHQGDAMTWPLDGYDAIHASPPCQDWSRSQQFGHNARGTGWMLPATINRLRQSGTPWIVENVEGAKATMRGAVLVCGAAFSLGTGGRALRRHRLFASSELLMAPGCCCPRKVAGVYGRGASGPGQRGVALAVDDARAAMRIDWMTRDELREAIPPVYTEYIGGQLIAHLAAA